MSSSTRPSKGHAVKAGEREANRFGVADGDGDQTGGTIDAVLSSGQLVVTGRVVKLANGNLPDYVKFTSSRVSGKEGTIEVKGLDAGSYKVTEIQTPDPAKYPTTADPFTFTIRVVGVRERNGVGVANKVTILVTNHDILVKLGLVEDDNLRASSMP